ncbi:MAG: aldolase catalytic domain-containing protein [Spirochaetales bacterium]|nr:aldolase catalytic domain-containing protein [Spirochaetales bacterium]
MKKVQLIDCTIRDGGLMNNWEFSLDAVRALYKANGEAGVDIMEMGYRVSPKVFKPEDHGPWRFCQESLLRQVTGGIKSSVKIAVMADIGRCFKEDFIPRKDSVIQTVRLACYMHQIDEAIELSDHLNRLGYETFFNIMAVSAGTPEELRSCLEKVDRTGAEGVYLADTFGSFVTGDIRERLDFYRKNCPHKKLGFHGHNNIQMALANSLEAIREGVEYVDASYYGMGRGAGNTPLELLLPLMGGTEPDMSPVVRVIQNHIEPLMEIHKWGYRIPYGVSGLLNQHPREAMALVASERESCYGEFYERSAG